MKNPPAYRCETCDMGPSIDEVAQKLSVVYYLTGWKLLIYRYFMKHVMPDIVKGQKSHNKLIQQGHIGHQVASKMASQDFGGCGSDCDFETLENNVGGTFRKCKNCGMAFVR